MENYAPSETTAQPEEQQPQPIGQYDVVLIDQTKDARDAARQAAEERLTGELNEQGAGFFKRLYNGVVKGNIAREYYILRYQTEAERQIGESGVLRNETDAAGRARAEQSLIDRYQSEFDNSDVIHEEAGEKRDIVGPDSQLSREFKQLIGRHVSGELDDEALAEERDRLLRAFADNNEEYKGLFGEGKARVDNMLAIARSVRGAVDHGESLDDVLSNMRIVVGEARSNVRTEIRYNRVDKAVEKLQSSRLGALMGPEAIITSVTLAASLLKVGSRKAVGAALMTLTPAAAAGLWAGLRENKRTKDERVQHTREMAQGKILEQGAKRREEMETVRYETQSALSLINEIESKFSKDNEWQTDEQILDAFATLAAVEARIKYSDQNRVDLVSYTDAESIEDERFELDLVRAQAKVLAASRLDESTRSRLRLDGQTPVDEIVNRMAQQYIDSEITAEISTKDEAFKKLKTKRVAKAAATGALVGLVGGMVVQETVAAFDPAREGIVEQLWSHRSSIIAGVQHNTLLYGLLHGDKVANIHHAPSSTFKEYLGGKLQVPDDYKVNMQNGEMQIVDPTGRSVVEHVPIENNGTLSSASQEMLRHAGIVIDSKSSVVDGGPEFIPKNVSVKDYITAHPDRFTHIKRDFWYDNDTPAPVFDKNELGLWESGVNDSGISSNEHFAYSVAHMREDGSYSGNHVAHWNELLAQGKLKVALSLNKGTQSNVMFVDIKPNGSIDIDPNSDAGKLFASKDGKSQFLGAYMEVVEVSNTDASGATHIRPLATIVGNNSIKSLVDQVPAPKTEVIINKLMPSAYEESRGSFTEMAPVIPIVPRRPLENISRQRNESYYYGGEVSAEEASRLLAQMSPRIQANPDAELNPREELDFFKQDVLSRRGQAAIDKIDRAIDSSIELSSMSGVVDTIITIPVAATQEADNIYKTLSLYGQQDVDAQRSSIVLINLNWLDTATNNPDANAQIDRTRQEIERARRDFPDIKIAIIENQYSASEVQKTGGVIGYVVQDLADAALMSIQRGMQAGRITNDHEVVLIRNDADMQGLSRHYLSQFQESFRNNKRTDVFKGVTRFGVGSAEKFPGFSIVSNFTAGLALATTAKGVIHTGGANFGIRASTMAATGCLGKLDRSGSGSDDVMFGRRIKIARRLNGEDASAARATYSQSSTYSTTTATTTSNPGYAKPVFGATVDTNPDRLIPQYLSGTSYQDAWAGRNFGRGPGGYRARNADTANANQIDKESTDLDSDLYRFIETNISAEIAGNDTPETRRMLAVWFGAVPGAYSVRNGAFKLTDAGKRYIKNRIERETNGRFGSYGHRKMRQLYGDISGRRQPASKESPLITPLK